MRGGRRLTACRAMVADDREEVIGGDLGRALLGEEGAQVKALEGEGHVAADLERVHDLVPKALQVNAQDLRWGGGERCWSFVGWPGAHDPRHLMEVWSQGSGTPPTPPPHPTHCVTHSGPAPQVTTRKWLQPCGGRARLMVRPLTPCEHIKERAWGCAAHPSWPP